MKHLPPRRRVRIGRLILVIFLPLFLLIGTGAAISILIQPKEEPKQLEPVDGLPLTLLDYGIAPLPDYDHDGVDDFREIVYGARIDAQNMVTYRSAYYAGGYPPDDEGVCTDLIWRALKQAGYSLKDLIDEDIKARRWTAYDYIEFRDPNIDFRRVLNVKIFLDAHAVKLTNDIYDLDQWMPGDFVVFGDDFSHIAVISDIKNINGIPFIIHNSGQPKREEDRLEIGSKTQGVTGHYRWILTP